MFNSLASNAQNPESAGLGPEHLCIDDSRHWLHLCNQALYHDRYIHTAEGMIWMLSLEILKALARRGRVELIRTLRAYPDQDFTINELAKRARLPTMTVWRATRELKGIGLLKTKKAGNALMVSLTEDRDKLRTLRLIPETDPHRMAAIAFSRNLAVSPWLEECRLFGTVARGEHTPGEEVDVAVVYRDELISEEEAKTQAKSLAEKVKQDTNIAIVPLCLPQKDMSRKGGLASELRDKEVLARNRRNLNDR